jgi:hypothetical protein
MFLCQCFLMDTGFNRSTCLAPRSQCQVPTEAHAPHQATYIAENIIQAIKPSRRDWRCRRLQRAAVRGLMCLGQERHAMGRPSLSLSLNLSVLKMIYTFFSLWHKVSYMVRIVDLVWAELGLILESPSYFLLSWPP